MVSQFAVLRSRALLILASGYLFTAPTALVHALTFPGLFTPAGLLSGGAQTTAWIYMVWHGGFPLFVLGYALTKSANGPKLPYGVGRAVLTSALCVAAAVLLCTYCVLGALSIGVYFTPSAGLMIAAAATTRNARATRTVAMGYRPADPSQN